MRRPGMALAVALVLVTDMVVLAGVLANRAGEPEAAVEMTERELPLAWQGKENTGTALELRWQLEDGRWQEPTWIDRSRLQALGFDCSMPADDPRAQGFYSKALPRKAYVVLEFDGQAWQRFLAGKERELAEVRDDVLRGKLPAERAAMQERYLEMIRKGHSRLFAVAVGADPEALRREYAEKGRTIIAEGRVALRLEPHRLTGSIQEISIPRIHVPRGKAAFLEALRREVARGTPEKQVSFYNPQGEGTQEPRYRVRLIYGRRLEPWVDAIIPVKDAP